MNLTDLPTQLRGSRLYMVGIKGTGMTALAEILAARGAELSGSDVSEVFYTDRILRRAGIPISEGFSANNLPPSVDCVIYSAAYDPDSHPELLRARDRRIPLIQYNEALGALSRRQPSAAIAGVHGKTTTTALAAALVEQLELPWTVLAGSALGVAGDRSTLIRGQERLIAETCEYRRHFLAFSPDVLVVTSVEADHLDYFRDVQDVEAAFCEFVHRLPQRGTLIFCADDEGATAVAARARIDRPDLVVRSYGSKAPADVQAVITDNGAGSIDFAIESQKFSLHVPGSHNVQNAAAALALVEELCIRSGLPGDRKGGLVASSRYPAAQFAFQAFRGTRRRSEIVGAVEGVLVLDDYAHHPTAIATTLAGFRSFYPQRRIVLSFMSHTFSRTLALLEEFAKALGAADVLILHDIYASAREANPGDVDGSVLVDAVRDRSANKGGPAAVHYVARVDDALPLIDRLLEPGDLFVTMGAGDNWKLGRAWLESHAEEAPS